MANCNAVSGPNGNGRLIAPIVLTADGMRGIWARTTAKPSHHQLASRSASTKVSRSMSPSKRDEGVRSEHEQRQVEDRTPRDAAQPDQVLIAGVQRLAHPLAHVVELDVCGLEGVLQPRRHRRLLEERQDGDEVLVAEHPTGSRRRRLLVGQQQCQTDQLRSILGLGAGFVGDRRRRQVAEAERAVGMGDDAVEVEPAVDDAGVVQPAQVVPQRRHSDVGGRDPHS